MAKPGFPLGPPLRETSAEPSVWRVRDFFPLNGRSVVTVKETADGRRREGEQRVGPNEIGAQCATLPSAPS